jgi:micrococcal nuclease
MKVVDGDTLVIDMNGVGTTLRLIGLDTPETIDPRKPVQCFGKAASDKAKELLTGKRVSIEKDMSQGEVDKYGRLLAYIYLPDGRLFNRYMIAEGYGHEYTYRLPYKYQKEFKAAEARARSEKKGLWADSACATQSARTVSAASPSMTNVPSGSPASAKASSGNYDCSHNVYNCPSFKTQAEAQKVFDACGLPGQGGDSNDVHKLDSDKDGRVCESLP